MKAFEAAVAIAAGMDEDDGVDLFGLVPERPQLRIAEFHRPGGGRDRRPLESQVAHAALELAHCERRDVQRQRAEADQSGRMRGNGLRDPIVGHTRKPQTRLRVCPFQALMHKACAQHLDVNSHRIHVADALRNVAHPREDGGGPFLDMASHLVSDAGIGGQLGKDVVLRGDRIDFRHDDVRVEVDCPRPRAAR